MPEDLRLLVVDDEAQILELLQLSLAMNGFQVSTAQSGPEALSLIVHNAFDVLVMDVLMAPWDGFETVNYMYEEVGPALPPVVYLSGINREAEAPQLAGHLHRYLVKPFRPSELVLLIRELWNLSNAPIAQQ